MGLRASELRRINRTFEYFGRTPSGALRVKWFDTTELFYHVEVDKTMKLEGSGLWVVRPEWQRHCWRDRIGAGWVIAVWKPAPPLQQFIDRYGSLAPYKPQGDYEIIENTKRDVGDPPNERNTALLKKLLIDQLYRGASLDGGAHKTTEILDSLADQYALKQERTRKTIEDEIDDMLPAFGRPPGKRGGSVSIGGF